MQKTIVTPAGDKIKINGFEIYNKDQGLYLSSHNLYGGIYLEKDGLLFGACSDSERAKEAVQKMIDEGKSILDKMEKQKRNIFDEMERKKNFGIPVGYYCLGNIIFLGEDLEKASQHNIRYREERDKEIEQETLEKDTKEMERDILKQQELDQRVRDRGVLNGDEFQEVCKDYGINLHARTKGFLNKRVISVLLLERSYKYRITSKNKKGSGLLVDKIWELARKIRNF